MPALESKPALSKFWRIRHSYDQTIEMRLLLRDLRYLIEIAADEGDFELAWANRSQCVISGDRVVPNNQNRMIKLDFSPFRDTAAPFDDSLVDVVSGHAAHEAGHLIRTNLPKIKPVSKYERPVSMTDSAQSLISNILEDVLIDHYLYRYAPILIKYIQAGREWDKNQPQFGANLDKLRQRATDNLFTKIDLFNLWIDYELYGITASQELADFPVEVLSSLLELGHITEDYCKHNGLVDSKKVMADVWSIFSHYIDFTQDQLGQSGDSDDSDSDSSDDLVGFHSEGDSSEDEKEDKDDSDNVEDAEDAAGNSGNVSDDTDDSDDSDDDTSDIDSSPNVNSDTDDKPSDNVDSDNTDDDSEDIEDGDSQPDTDTDGNKEPDSPDNDADESPDEDNPLNTGQIAGIASGSDDATDASAGAQMDPYAQIKLSCSHDRNDRYLPDAILDELQQSILQQREDLQQDLMDMFQDSFKDSAPVIMEKSPHGDMPQEKGDSMAQVVHGLFQFRKKAKTRYSHGMNEGELEPNSLWKIGTGDDRIYRQKDVLDKLDIAICLLVDASSSVASSWKILERITRALAIGLSHKQGVKLATVGYRTGDASNIMNYSSPVYGVTKLLRLYETGDTEVRTMEPGGGTPSVTALCAMPIYLGKLFGRSKDRLIIHVTDGFPHDEGNMKLPKAIKQLRDRFNIEVYCLAIGRTGDTQVQMRAMGVNPYSNNAVRMYQDRQQTQLKAAYGNKFTVLDSYEELPRALQELLRSVLITEH